MTLLLAAMAYLLLVTLCYGLVCAASPYGDCRKCDGLGFKLRHTRSGKTKRGKTCRRCQGHGKRARIGRLAFNYAHRLYREAR